MQSAGDRVIDVRILGRVRVSVGDEELDFGGSRRRMLLTILLLERNRVVPIERLIDEIWGERPPVTAAKAVQNLVVQVRKTLGAADGVALRTEPPGYVLHVADERIDAYRFEEMLSEGARLRHSDPAGAVELLGAALDLWSGDALADFRYAGFAQAELARLEELRLVAIEELVDARLELGDASELVPELEALVTRHSERERLHGQLMVALYRSGRQTEALDVFQGVRARLDDELGLEPGPALRQLQQAILVQDPTLGPSPKLPAAPRRRRRRVLLASAAVALVSALGAVVGATRDGRPPVVVPNAVVRINATSNAIVDVVPVGKDPGQLAVVGDYVFVSSQQDGTVSRIRRDSGELTTSGRFDATGSIADEGSSHLWVVSVTRNVISRMSAAILDADNEIPLSRDSVHLLTFVDVGGGSLWTSEWYPPQVTRWNLTTLARVGRYPLADPEYPLEVTFGQRASWTALWTTDRLLRIDAVSGRPSEIAVGGGPRSPAAGFGSIWVAMGEDGTVWRIDPRSGKPRAVIPVGKVPWGVAVGPHAVWVSANCDGTVSRIDPETNQVEATIEVGFHPQWLVADDEHVWVGVSDQASGVPAAGPAALALPKCG